MDQVLGMLAATNSELMTPKAFSDMLQAVDPTSFTPATCEGLVKELGTNADGMIDVKKFLMGMSGATGAKPTHVAIVGAGFVGTMTAYAVMLRKIGAYVTLTDVAEKKCEGEVQDLEDSGACPCAVATNKEAGQADVIVITAGRGQREGETRLDLTKANAGILESIIEGMKPIKPTAKIIIVSNPCDALTFKAQECSGLPISQVFGSGCLLDSRRMRIELGKILKMDHSGVNIFTLGEHGDSQFPAFSLAKVGTKPLMDLPAMKGVDTEKLAASAARKAYEIIGKKRYTAFGVGTCVAKIVGDILGNTKAVLPVSVRVPGKRAVMSMPAVVGINGIESIQDISPYLSADEKKKWDASVEQMELAVKVLEGSVDPKSISAEGKPKPETAYPRGPIETFEPGHNPTHVAVVGAGFVGTTTAYACLLRGTGAKVTLTDVMTDKCMGEVLDLEDTGGQCFYATPAEAGQADVIVISAGRGQKDGETRLDLVKANSAIMRSVISGMQPIKKTAKIVVVSNPCDALTYVAQEASGLPQTQVFGSGTLLDSRRLWVELGKTLGLDCGSIGLYVLGEHGDSQFPAPSVASIGGIPLKNWPGYDKVDIFEMGKKTGKKAYEIIGKKNYTAFGVATAVQEIVSVILNDVDTVLPVSVRVPGKKCCMSLPCVVGTAGIQEILDPVDNLDAKEKELYDASIAAMETAAAAAMEGQ